jgi:hypothetical protein
MIISVAILVFVFTWSWTHGSSARLDWMDYLRFYSAVLSALILYIFPACFIHMDGAEANR